MQRFVKILLGVLIFIIAAAVVAPYLINIDSYKKQLTAIASKELGRNVAIKGPLKFRILPTPRLKIKDLEIASIEGTQNPNLATISAANFSVDLLPLFVGNVVIKEIRLEHPKVYLETLAGNRNNWTLDIQSDKDDTEKEEKDAKGKSKSSMHLEVQNFIIEEGLISMTEGNDSKTFEDINLRASLDSLKGPFDLEGSLSSLNIPVDFKGHIAAFDKTMPLEFEIHAFKQSIQLSGDYTMDKGSFIGNLKLRGTGDEIAKLSPNLPEGLRQDYKVTSKISYDGKALQLSKFQGILGTLNAFGQASYTLADKRLTLELGMNPGQIALKAQNKGNDQIQLSLTARNLESLLTALKVNIASLPEDLLHNIDAALDLKVKDGSIIFNGLRYEQGQAKLTGSGSYGPAPKQKEATKITYDIQTPNLERLMRLVDHSFDMKIGSLAAKGETTIQGDTYQTQSSIMALGGLLNLQGTIQNKGKNLSYDMHVDLKGTNLESTLGQLGVTVGKPSLRAYTLKAQVKSQGALIQFPSFALDAKAGTTQLGVKGHGEFTPSPHRSKLVATLNFASLNLEKLMASYAPSHEERMLAWQRSALWSVAKKGSGKKDSLPKEIKPKFSQRWSTDPMDFSFLKTLDGDIQISIPNLESGSMAFKNMTGKIHMANGILEIPQLVAGAYGGSLTVKARLSSQKSQPLSLTIDIKNADLTNIIPRSNERFQVTKGTFNFSTNLTSQGRSQFEYIKNLNGPVHIDVQNGVITGFDLQKVTQKLNQSNSIAGLLSLLGNAFQGGQTKFNSLKGSLMIENGVARIETMKLQADGAHVETTGKMNLPAYTMNTDSLITLTEVKNLPPFHATFTGPLDNPSPNLETGALQEYFLNNVLKGVAGSIKGMKGGKPQDILKGILGVGGDQGNTENTAPASNGSQQNTEPSPQEEAPATQPAKDAEKALKGILKGLF